MIDDHDDPTVIDAVDEDVDVEESTDIMDIPTANVGEISVEIDVEELIAEIEADCGVTSGNSDEEPRKRLERILEERRVARELEEIDEYALEQLD